LTQAPAITLTKTPDISVYKQVGDIVQLRDAKTDSTISVLTGTSNAYEFVVHGKNVLSMNIPSTTALRNNPGLNGVPFLGPFANRLDEMAFYANGKKYNFDPELGNVRAPIPQQGFLNSTHDWKTVSVKADAGSATIAFVSDASNVGGCAPNCQMTLASQTVNVSGKVYTQAARSTAEDVELALDAAHAAADAWGKTSATERSNVLLKIADRIEANLELLELHLAQAQLEH
jgi:hypothetical protein